MHINRPEPGWYSITGAAHPGQRKKLRSAARIYRQCQCTPGGGLPHEWTDACDRYPQPIARIEGCDRENVNAVWHATGRAEITETEALSLMGVENLYV